MQILVQFASICALYGNGNLLLAGCLRLLHVSKSAPSFLLGQEDPAGNLPASGDVSDTGGGSVLHQSF